MIAFGLSSLEGGLRQEYLCCYSEAGFKLKQRISSVENDVPQKLSLHSLNWEAAVMYRQVA